MYRHVLNPGGRAVHSPLDRPRKRVGDETPGVMWTGWSALNCGGNCRIERKWLHVKHLRPTARRWRFRLREQVRAWGCGEAVLTKEYDIHRLFGASDAAVMVTSMAGLEAMAMGCPVVAVQTAGKDFEGGVMPPYVSAGAVERVDMGDPAALAATLRRLLTEPAARAGLVERGRRFAARYVHPVDGELARRLLAVVEEIRSRQRGGPSR